MSNLPPPSFGPPGAGPTPPSYSPPPGAPGAPPPGGFGGPPAGYGGPPAGGAPPPNWGGVPAQPGPPSGGKSNAPKIIIAVVIVALLAAGGIFLATRNGDTKATSNTEATAPGTSSPDTTAPATAAATTVAATTTTEAATTTTEAPTTTEATTTTLFAVPDGSADLGLQVYIPVPDGWTQSKTGDHQTTITDGTQSVSITVLARTPGEAAADVLNNYAKSLDTLGETVAYGPARLFSPLDGPLPVNETGIYYVSYDAAKGIGTDGGVYVFQRGDGLTAVYDIYGSGSVMGVSDDQLKTFQNSLVNAAAIGPVSPLPTGQAPFRVTTTHPYTEVDGLLGFTAAPGFTQVAAGGGFGEVANGTHDFAVAKLTGQASVDAALAQAESSLNNTNTGVTFGTPTTGTPDSFNVTSSSVQWTGTFNDGTPVTGSISVYFDSASGNAVAILERWATTADGTQPNPLESQFMNRAVYISFTTIP